MTDQNYIQVKTPLFWRATFALSIGAFLVFSNLHMSQPLLPLFTQEFGVSPATASLSVSLVTFTLSIFLLFFGPVSDSVGRKYVMAVGLLISSLLSICIFFVHHFTILLMIRTIQGIFLASLPAIAYAYIGEEFDRKSIGSVIGIYIAGNSLGGMGGRIISGFIADLWGWQYSFLVMGLIGLLSFMLFIFLLPPCKHFKSNRFSKTRAIKEMMSHWKNPVLRAAYYNAGIIFFIFVGLFNYLGFHLHLPPYSLSTSFIGLLYLSYIFGAFSSTLSGKLDHIFTIPQRVFIGSFVMLIGILLMLTKPLILILIGLTFVVIGFFFSHAASSSWVSHHAHEAKASASALYLFSYYIGGSLGSSFLGYIWEPFGWNAVILVTTLLVIISMWNARRMNLIEKKSNSLPLTAE